MSDVLSSDCTRIRFDTLEAVEDAVRIFAADPVIDTVVLPKTHLLWEKAWYVLHLPSRANERIALLLQRYRVPFIIETA